MVRVVGVRFKKAGKVYYFDPDELPIAAGQKVVVETARGVEYGDVAVGPKEVPEDQVVQPLKKVLRIGNEKDAVVAAENKRKEHEAFSVAQKKIEGHTLDMNLVDVEYTFDGSKIIFYFTAEGRIDFRELVRDLAGVFRTRIEMRQIGVRDEAKLLGGIGPCGRILCCTSFLGDFAPVSIRMAKDQNLSLNPSKISGLCGRLMCCLRYEQETYEAAKKDPTLAPGYVPPVLVDEVVPAIAELEDRPAPIIGTRGGRGESGMSARIAQAAGVVDRPRREERQSERPERSERLDRADRPERTDRPERRSGPEQRSQGSGGERRREQPQGQPRQQQPARQAQQGERRREQPQGGERQAPSQGGGERRRDQQGQARQNQQQGRPQRQQQQGGGEKQPQQQARQQQPRERQPNRNPQQNRPQGEGQQQAHRPQAERSQGATGEEQQQQSNRRHHHRGHRRRSGGGGGNQPGTPNPQQGGGGSSPS